MSMGAQFKQEKNVAYRHAKFVKSTTEQFEAVEIVYVAYVGLKIAAGYPGCSGSSKTSGPARDMRPSGYFVSLRMTF
eukprot:1076780-Ditylum_brightwellii.AAC.1